MQTIIDTITNWFNNLMAWNEQVRLSVIDFITDLPAILLEYATDFITLFLNWAGSYCTYCLGGSTLTGNGSAVSVFAAQLQTAYNALSPCVLYALNMSGVVGCLQILSCAMIIWSAFRIVTLVRSIA